MKERFTKLAPLAIPFVLFAAACKSDGSEKIPPKFEDGVSVGVTLTPTEEPALVQAETNPLNNFPVPKKTDAQRSLGSPRETGNGCMQTVVEKTDDAIYTYDIFCAPYTIDPVLRELPQRFLKGRLPQADFEEVHSLLLEIQSGDEQSGEKIVEVQKTLNINCQRDTADEAIDTIATAVMSDAFHNHPEIFEQNRDVFLDGPCYQGDMYKIEDAQKAPDTIKSQNPDKATYTKTLGGDSVVLYKDTTYDQLLSEENLTRLSTIFDQEDFFNLRTNLKSAQFLDSRDPKSTDIKQFLTGSANLFQIKCEDPVVSDNVRKLLSIIDQKYPGQLEEFASYAQSCNLTNNPS